MSMLSTSMELAQGQGPPQEKVADIQAAATVDWSPLGEIFVKKYVVYQMQWEVNLADTLVAIAPYGGPIALLSKTAGVKRTKAAPTPDITVYTMAGQLIKAFPWEGGRVVGMGWTASENLILILEEGTLVIYSILGDLLYTRILAREIREHRVMECKFFHTLEGSAGFAVMTYSYQFFAVADSDRSRDELRVKKLADLPTVSTKPSCWAVLPQSNILNVVAAVEDRLYVIDPFEATQKSVTCKKESPIYWAEIAISMNGKAAALVDRGGYIWGGSSDFKVCETEFDLQSPAKVLQMQWGGKDFFVLVMDRLMFVKGVGKHWTKYPLRSTCMLLPEIDGVRAVTSTTCEFINRVTSPSLAVLRIGSMEVGALLNDAYKEFEGDESHKADEYIRYIKDRLPEAIMQCIKAAGEEFSPKIQQSLLRSAHFGEGFLGPDIPQEVVNEFVEICHQLRVLNSVRDPRVGIAITFRQYYRLSTPVLIDRLINRGLYAHALEICNYLRVPPAKGEAKVLRQWSLRKVRDRSLKDDQIAEMIVERSKSTKVVVSFAEIARAAREEGRKDLAAHLLGHEVHAKDQVPLLMEMKNADLALDKAIESGDPQLVYRVLEELKFKHYHSQMDRYLKLFHHRPVAAALYKKLCKEVDREQLLHLHRQESDFLEAGTLLFAQSYTKRDQKESNRYLLDSMREFKDGQHLFALKVAEEQLKLKKEQIEIEAKFGYRVVGLSLFDTVIECVKGRQLKVAEQLKKDFKLSDTLYWWAKIRGLAFIGDYEELERFSKQKKSPIGYEPFAEVCIQRRNYREASKYIPKAAQGNKFRLYMVIEDLQKAADAAFQDRNVAGLEELQSKASRHPQLMEHIKMLKAKLGH